MHSCLCAERTQWTALTEFFTIQRTKRSLLLSHRRTKWIKTENCTKTVWKWWTAPVHFTRHKHTHTQWQIYAVLVRLLHNFNGISIQFFFCLFLFASPWMFTFFRLCAAHYGGVCDVICCKMWNEWAQRRMFWIIFEMELDRFDGPHQWCNQSLSGLLLSVIKYAKQKNIRPRPRERKCILIVLGQGSHLMRRRPWHLKKSPYSRHI